MNQQNEIKAPTQIKTWFGALRDGKFRCDCEPRGQAKCRTTVAGRNKGKRFWTCPKARDQQCPFFVWVEQEDEAKEWLAKHGPQEPPETPSKDNNSTVSKEPETPWTKAKRKPISAELSGESESVGPTNRKMDGGEVFDGEDEGGESPSRKAAKNKRFSTPRGQKFNERLKGVALPTPDSRDKEKLNTVEPAPVEAGNTSPAIDRSKDAPIPSRGGKEDLATSVLMLIRDDKVHLKESTKLQIRHEIDLELDLNAAKMRRFEDTNSKQRKRLDELENMLGHLIGDSSIEEISD